VEVERGHGTGEENAARAPVAARFRLTLQAKKPKQPGHSRPLPPMNHSAQPDHCSAGAGSTGQSKQRAVAFPHIHLARHRHSFMTDALNLYDGILKLKKMVLLRRAA
jgi:hypothetical protein